LDGSVDGDPVAIGIDLISLARSGDQHGTGGLLAPNNEFDAGGVSLANSRCPRLLAFYDAMDRQTVQLDLVVTCRQGGNDQRRRPA
jgi:hypothetical protein